MTAATKVDTSVYDHIPLEDRLYPMPINHPTEQAKPDHLREYRQAVKMGAERLPGASFLVVPPELDAESKSRLRLNFGGRQRERRREAALVAMRAEREQVKSAEAAARNGSGPDARTYLFTTPGEGEFGVETLKEIAKANDIKTFFDGARRLRFLVGEEVPEPLRRFVSAEAQRAYEAAFAVRGEELASRNAELVTDGVKKAEVMVASRNRGLQFSDPAQAPQHFAQEVLALSEMKAKDVARVITEMVGELRKAPEDERLQRAVRVGFAVMVDAMDRGPNNAELAQVGARRSELPEEALGGLMPDEARLMRVAYGYDAVAKPKREAENRVVVARQKPTGRGFSMFDR